MFIGLALFIAALASGKLGHDHGAEGHNHSGHTHSSEVCHHHHHHEEHSSTCHIHQAHNHEGAEFKIDLLSEDWMNVLFAGLSVIVLIVLLRASDHFIEEHLYRHIVLKHLPKVFAWTFGVLICMGILLQFFDVSNWISNNAAIMILLAAAVGFIPESGPHMVFVTLYAAGAVPFPVLLASSISQDGHASLPLLAESKSGFAKAKAINFAVALAVGYLAMLF